MKSIHFVFVVFMITALMLTGCAIRTPPPPPVILTLPPAPTKTSVPSVELVSPTITAPAQLTQPPSNVLFRDDFNGQLAEGWTWMYEYPTAWSLTAVPQTLQIMAGSGSLNAGTMTNVLVRPAPQDNFEVITLVTFKPESNFQFAGLLMYESNDRYLQAGREFCSISGVCSGDGLYLEVYRAEKLERQSPEQNPSGGNTVFLMLRREDTMYTFLASGNGTVWHEISRRNVNINPAWIGVLAGQNPHTSIPANFDFFEVHSLP